MQKDDVHRKWINSPYFLSFCFSFSFQVFPRLSSVSLPLSPPRPRSPGTVGGLPAFPHFSFPSSPFHSLCLLFFISPPCSTFSFIFPYIFLPFFFFSFTWPPFLHFPSSALLSSSSFLTHFSFPSSFSHSHSLLFFISPPRSPFFFIFPHAFFFISSSFPSLSLLFFISSSPLCFLLHLSSQSPSAFFPFLPLRLDRNPLARV